MGEYDFQTEVLQRLTRIEAGQEERCASREVRLCAVEEGLKEHDDAIHALRERRSFSAGQTAGLTTGAGLVAAAALKLTAWLWGAR